jgi:hypothetical protein
VSGARGRGWALPGALIAIAVVIWMVPLQLVPLWSQNQINPDVNLYRIYAGRIAHGALAYRDVQIEYPPGATGLFSLVWWIPGNYGTDFSAVMLLCLCICLLGVVQTARALGYSPVRQALAGGIVAMSPLLLGSLVGARFDMAVAAIVVWMLYAAVTERWRWMWVLLAAGILIKLVPLALIPLLVIWHARRVDWRAAMIGAVAAVAIVAAVVIPFAILSPSGTWYFVAYNLRRPPQIESAVASLFLAAHAVAGLHVPIVLSYGSINIAGHRPHLLANVLSVVLVALVLVIAVRCAQLLARAHPTRATEVLICGATATMVSLTVTGKVLSPQYMVWLLPVIPLVAGRYWRAATATFVAVLLLTQVEFPNYYWDVVALHRSEIIILIVRNLLLIALLVLCWPRRGLGALPVAGRTIGGTRDRSASGPATSISARHIVD